MTGLGKISTKRFLITGANGDIANAIGRVLQSSFPDARIIGADLGDDWPGRSVFAEMHTLPHADDATYLDALHELADEAEVTCIVPSTEPELNKITYQWDTASDLPLLVNYPEVIRMGLDKLETNRWLNLLGLETPLTSLLEESREKDRWLDRKKMSEIAWKIVEPQDACAVW